MKWSITVQQGQLLGVAQNYETLVNIYWTDNKRNQYY